MCSLWLTKQQPPCIADLLVERIVSRHGVPTEILSDRGAAFLSGLMKEVENLLGFHKVNTTAYHPQTDGLVERLNRTLTTMLAKTTERGSRGKDWDRHLPYVLFAYRASQQESTLESPFFLLYGRDSRLPTEIALSPTNNWRMQLDLKEYGVDLVSRHGSLQSLVSAKLKSDRRSTTIVSHDHQTLPQETECSSSGPRNVPVKLGSLTGHSMDPTEW